MNKIQQGDVILRKTNQSLKGGKKLNHLVLAEGESTGHSHQIVSGIATLIALQDKTILNVLSDYALLKHEEHSMKKTIQAFERKENIPDNYVEYLKQNEKINFDKLTFNEIVSLTHHETVIPKGKWINDKPREYDHFKEEAREVVD